VLASAAGIVAFDQVVPVGLPDKMAATGLPELVFAPAMAQIVALGHATADAEVTPAGMLVAGDHVSDVPMAPERITGPVTEPVVVEPTATHTEDEGQVS
jgi:hypothetical protein